MLASLAAAGLALTTLATDAREGRASSPPATTATATAASGSLAPGFSLLDADGRAVSLSELNGKVVVLDFWATWCAPCQRSLVALTEAFRGNSDVVLLAINVDDRETRDQVRRFLASKKLDVRALLKGNSTSRRFGVGPIPHAVVIDRDGKVVSHHVGITSESALVDALNRDIAKAK